MKYISQSFLVAILALFSTQSFSQVSLSTLQKLALLNSNNVYTLPVEIREILEPKGFKNIQRRWVKGNNVNGKEIITINATFEGNMISYESYNIPKTKILIESIKKLGNFTFNNDEGDKTYFRATDKKLYYDVHYVNNYSRCVIAIFKYSEPPEKEIKEVDSVATKETTMVVVTKDAEFVGGQNALNKYISQNINIPDDATDWHGKLDIKFVIDTTGSIINVEVLNDRRNENYVPASLVGEIKRLFKAMPKWKPAETSDNKAVISNKQMPLQL